jgi:hypothetical protein
MLPATVGRLRLVRAARCIATLAARVNHMRESKPAAPCSLKQALKLAQLISIEVRNRPVRNAAAVPEQNVVAFERITSGRNFSAIVRWPKKHIHDVQVSTVHECSDATPTDVVDAATQEWEPLLGEVFDGRGEIDAAAEQRWSRLSQQIFRFDKWSLRRG